MPATPRASQPWIGRLWGLIHYHLQTFSGKYYCRWMGIHPNYQIAPLPFGLVLKWSDGTREEEVRTMQVCRAAGLPVPRVISYGMHPSMPHAPVSILMTRLPGRELGLAWDGLDYAARRKAAAELRHCLDAIRRWSSPWRGERICSLRGGAIRSVRVPAHSIGPCASEHDFHERLRKAAWCLPTTFPSRDKFDAHLACARRIHDTEKHAIVFTHGDLKEHNLLVDPASGALTGFLDWEAAGWYPAYWDYTTAVRMRHRGDWWHDLVMDDLGGAVYVEELKCERVLMGLTSASFAW
ncbi:MAG: hypothetical protein M1832_002107 [Thelocarpon impressellum]|nr:MAG: hypothetical protein M1832_002107 [Thelocarpon impressellum]